MQRLTLEAPGIEPLGARKAGPAGLDPCQVAERLARYGPNTLVELPRPPLYRRLFGHFSHMMAVLLWAGGAIALAAAMPQLAVAIWAVNLINGVFSFWQEYQAERATEALKRLLPRFARVVRQGRELRIPAEDLVPGDVILLAEGDHVSADARLLSGAELRVDQSSLTGEAQPVAKSAQAASDGGWARFERPDRIFAGSSVTSGTARALVLTTGMDTEFGKIARLTQSVGEEYSPLQRELIRVTRIVSYIAIGVGVAFFIVAVALTGMGAATAFIFSLGMIVAFVPEGLLPTVTLALAMGVRRIARRNALVKRLSSVETLGSASVICTDKTGTLTQNEMTVREIWAGGRRHEVTGVGYEPVGEVLGAATAELRELLRAAVLCNDARLLPPGDDSRGWTILGDPTEAALQVAARKARVDPEAERARLPRLAELPFDSRRKRMTTLHPGVAYMKGALFEVLQRSVSILWEGEELPLDSAVRKEILATEETFARKGLRVLALARGRAEGPVPPDSGLVFLGLVGMLDPPRPEVAEAVKKCHRAGIRILMITGDHGLTAEAIARRTGIVGDDPVRLVTGTELDTMEEPALREALEKPVIFARVSPEHKMRLVLSLQNQGRVVAMTGDGVNDAPALKRADIGVAMGRSGSDVAREAADMILADDSFSSIVHAVEEGRAVYANIRRFISYIFTSNIPEAVPFILYALSGGRIPLALNVMQILSIDLGTDLVPALALGAEPPEPGVMDGPPRRPDQHLVNRSLLVRACLFLGLAQATASLAAFYLYYRIHGFPQWIDLPDQGAIYAGASTMALGAVVATQIGNLLAHRTETRSLFTRGLGGNPLLAVGVLSEILFLGLLSTVPALQSWFGTHSLGLWEWLYLAALTPVLWLLDEARKAWLRRKEKP